MTCSSQVIYTDAASNPDAINYDGTIGANTFLFAPNGDVKTSGSNVTVNGGIVAQNVFLAGGGQSASGGIDVPVAGPVSLVQ